MIQPLINNYCLIFVGWFIKFEPSDLRGDKSASLMRLFSFKENTNKRQVSAFSNEVGVSTKLRQRLAYFICLNFVEVLMLYSKSARAKLNKKLSVLSVAVTAAVSKIKEFEGSQSLNAAGIQYAFDEFTAELNQFVENHSLYPANEEKIRLASRKLNYQFNWMLNGVIESINIIPRSERVN